VNGGKKMLIFEAGCNGTGLQFQHLVGKAGDKQFKPCLGYMVRPSKIRKHFFEMKKSQSIRLGMGE
jgi:hypothetical protein